MPDGQGFEYEIQEVVDCLKQGKLESDVMPLDETLSIMQTMDAIRRKIGLVYDNDTIAELNLPQINTDGTDETRIVLPSC